jgi:hypothetical protein
MGAVFTASDNNYTLCEFMVLFYKRLWQLKTLYNGENVQRCICIAQEFSLANEKQACFPVLPCMELENQASEKFFEPRSIEKHEVKESVETIDKYIKTNLKGLNLNSVEEE